MGQNSSARNYARGSGTSARNNAILIYEQTVDAEIRFVYYAESDSGRLLAVVMTERKQRIRVITAYDLDAGQKRDYLTKRLREN